MLHVPGLSAYNFRFDNWGTNPGTSFGTLVTPGASDVEGSWTQVAASGSITQDCYWLHVFVHTGATSGSIKSHLLDIGVDPAGGTSYSAIISDIVCGRSPSVTTAGGSAEFVFPFYIKSGSSVAVRVQGSNATAGTVRVAVAFYGQPTNPAAVPVGNVAQTFGSITGSQGQTFTPGNAADGSWADFGAVTTSPKWWWQLGVQTSGATTAAERCYVDVAWGDGSNKIIMYRNILVGTSAETTGSFIVSDLILPAAFNPVPVGANIYVRGRCENAPDSTYNATVIGIGG